MGPPAADRSTGPDRDSAAEGAWRAGLTALAALLRAGLTGDQLSRLADLRVRAHRGAYATDGYAGSAAAAGRRAAMAKLYLRDGRQRLEREYDTLAFLRRRGLRSVPAPLARSNEHYYAVFSLEAGEHRPAARWTEILTTAAAAVAVELHGIRPADADVPLRTAISSAFSHAEGIGRIRARLGRFSAYLAGLPDHQALPAEIRDLRASMDPVAEVERLIAAATRGASRAQLEARVPEARWRLDVGDYAPHNVLIRPPAHPDGTLCVLDLEYAGWDAGTTRWPCPRSSSPPSRAWTCPNHTGTRCSAPIGTASASP
jgi:hypothetical protein